MAIISEVFYVYIMSNMHRTVLYVGFTNDIERRVYEHKTGYYENSFTKRYNCFDLMWYDEYRNPKEAKAVEYKMKRWKRAWKEEVIFAENPEMDDLAEDWDFTLYLE